MALIDDVKATLRISNTAYNTEISDLILSAKADLGICGLLSITETDPLIKRAIILYCKANFGFDNPDATRLQESYEMLRNHLSLSTDYAFFPVTFTVENSIGDPIREVEIMFSGEIKTTNSLGVAVFYAKAGSNYPYTVNNNISTLLDIADATEITITLEV